jgi:hypothetical protein
MFYAGFSDNGICSAGGSHQASGFNFALPHDLPGTPTAQDSWRFCQQCYSMFYDGYTDKGNCPGGGGHSAAGFLFVLPHDIPGTGTAQDSWRYCQKCHSMFYDGFPDKGICSMGASAYQDSWRYCEKCQAMFYDGYPDKGRCPAGGGHQGVGFDFVLAHDIPAKSTSQESWRYCQKCHSMFYDGSANKGHCAAGGGHESAGFNFVLPHDIPGTPRTQDSWRYCEKCQTMFYDGYPKKGNCPAGGGHQSAGFNFVLFHDIPYSGHEAAGFNFVLPHDLPGILDFDARPLVFDGGVPVGGWSHLTLRQDGSLTFTGHFHDSGATEYNTNFIFAVKDSQNIVYTVTHSGRVYGTFEPGSRDDDWTVDTRNDQLADNWANLAAGHTWVANGSAKMDGTDLFNSVIGVMGAVLGVVALFMSGSSGGKQKQPS